MADQFESSLTEASAEPPAGISGDDAIVADSLKTSRYERVSNSVIALNILFGVAVTLMFLVWASFQTGGNTSFNLSTQWLESDDEPRGYENSPEEPGLEEIEDMVDPQIAKTMEAITHIVSNVAAHTATFDGETGISSPGQGPGKEGRGPGGKGGPKVVPRWERWRVSLKAANARRFGALLDELEIHIGVFGGGDPVIYYAHDFSKSPKQYKRNGGKSEKRLYFAPGDKNAKQFTTRLARDSGLATSGKSLVHFYTPELEKRLAQAEQQYAKGRSLQEIRRTYFRVKRQSGKLEFVVTKQEYNTTTY